MKLEKEEVLRVKERELSDSEARFIQILQKVEDPRDGESCNFRHSLETVLFIAIICALCGADDIETIEFQANGMKEWLGRYVDMKNGVPSVRTFKRVFAALSSEGMERLLIELMDFLREKVSGEVISFDGKTMRGTSSSEKGLKAIQMLSAWSHDNGICLGHLKVDDKSNEITAMPKLMELLELKGTIITADALHTQKETAAKAIEVGGDYVLPVKGNQPQLLEELELLFKEAEEKEYRGFDSGEYETLEKSRGRLEVRRYCSIDAEELPSAKEWKGLRSAGMVVRERTEKEKKSSEVIYYISSCEVDAKLLEKVTRGHWGIENSLHFVLDVTFREDKLRYRERAGAQNLATIRKMVLGVLAKDKTYKNGKAGKRIRAATDEKYRELLLKSFL